MFRKKRQKPHFPPGTFIPTRLRVLAIIQLCLAFSIICYNLGTPFLGEVFEVKELQALYRSIVESPLFAELDGIIQRKFIELYRAHLAQGHSNFSQKILAGFTLLCLDMPPFKMAWLFFSVVIPLLLLKKVEGAARAVWLLPLVTLFYCLDNQYFYAERPAQQEQWLFPSEFYLTERYLKTPLSPVISKQLEELRAAWDRYLITEWANEVPVSESAAYRKQVEKGAFQFNLARFKAKQYDRTQLPRYEWRLSPFLLLLFLAWNLCFAVAFHRKLSPCA